MLLQTTRHKTYYGLLQLLGVGSLCIQKNFKNFLKNGHIPPKMKKTERKSRNACAIMYSCVLIHRYPCGDTPEQISQK